MSTSTDKAHLLRHVVLASPDIEKVSADLQALLKIPAGGRHDMGALGFKNEMMMVGTTMVELVQPAKPDHRLHRWFAEHGGEGGYMLVFQTFDADAFRERCAKEKLRLTRDMLFSGQDMIQVDPARFGAHLETYKYTRADGWWGNPAGGGYAKSPVASEIVGADVAVSAAPPAEIAAQVGRLFQSRVDGTSVQFVEKTVRFQPANTVTGLIALDLKASDRSMAGRNARICGMDIRLV